MNKAVLVFGFDFPVSADVVRCSLHVENTLDVCPADFEDHFRPPSNDPGKFLFGRKPLQAGASSAGLNLSNFFGNVTFVVTHRLGKKPVKC